MKFDIGILILIQSLTFATQVIVLFVQYRVNRTYRGIGWWVMGSTFMALGVIFMSMLTVKPLFMLARLSNPLVVLGQIFIYVGIMRFLDKKENRGMLISIFAIFILSYFNYMYFNNSISARTVVINTTLASISIMTAYQLFFKKDRFIAGTANFTATVFLLYGVFLIVRVFFALLLPAMKDYSDQANVLIAGLITPGIASTLWTFGFIIMVNQRLNIENLVEKEKMQQIFNASPDAVLITRLNDGLFMDVNAGFSVIMGYTHGEAVGDSALSINLWNNITDRQIFLTELNEKGIFENMEFVFKRKDGSQFLGMISAKIITIYDVPYIVSTIRDITEIKLAEQQIQQLVKQLEIERNTAELNSITDSLTGLVNRRYFDEALKTEFYTLKPSGSTLSLIMLDVDYFKKFNDSYGHLAGDDCLRKIGTTLKTVAMGTPAIAARYGGEEFVVILPEIEVNAAVEFAEGIRKAIEELAMPHSASDISKYVTVSMGVVSVCTTGFELPEQVVALVDEAMYSAKEGGRNRIEVSTDKLCKGTEPCGS